MANKLPWPSSPHWSYKIDLDGFNITLKGDYIEASGWHLSFFDEDGTEILSQRRVVANWNLKLNNRDPRLPNGVFFVSSELDVPERTDFDDGKAIFRYLTHAEAIALEV